MPCRIIRSAFLFFLLTGCTLPAFAQNSSRKNRAEYYGDPIHFGFYLGINRTNFQITPVNNLVAVGGDSLKTILSSPQTGFNLGIVSELRLIEYLTLRFTPDIAFGARNIEYHFETSTDTFDIIKNVESTFLDFPLDFKIRSKRLTNFAAYMTAGMKYTLDLASQKDVNNAGASLGLQVIKLYKNDWAYEAGAGVDFFLPYFKFGIDLKISLGLRNLLVPDNTVFARSIERLRSKVFLVSFTFEG
ncbi:MAG TPA: porin family protein [Bacteroidia bacterium]|nr:porin family protein [Bacteroidia bacterium]